MRLNMFLAGQVAMACVFGSGLTVARAGTNGFVVPLFRGSAGSQAGYWESFTDPLGLPGNLADQPGATTSAVLTQSHPSAFITGSGNIYNLNGASAFIGQPYRLQSAPATLARWMYPFNANPDTRPTASVYGALGSTPDFDSRDAQFLVGWTTSGMIPAGEGAANYLVRRARVTLTIASGNQYTYTGTLRDYRTYFPTSDPRYIPAAGTSSPVELYGAGFRGGYADAEGVFVPYTATNYPQGGPWGVSPTGGFYTNRVAYAAGFDTHGTLVDVSNNVGDDGTNEITGAFEVAPFAVGQTTHVAPGELMPLGSRLTFDLNLEDPLIYGYVQRGLNEGNLSFIVASLVEASFGGPPTYPNFYTPFSFVADPGEYPLLDIDGAIVRPGVDSDGDSLPDDWEDFHMGSLIGAGTDDPDGDRFGNRAEYEAGTMPASASSALRVIAMVYGAGISDVHFTLGPSRNCSVHWSEDMQLWQTVENPPLIFTSEWLSKTGPNPSYPCPVYTVWRDTGPLGPRRFYRISVE